MNKNIVKSAGIAALAAAVLFTGCSKFNPDTTLVTINTGDGTKDTISLGYASFAARYQQSMYDQYLLSYYGEGMWSTDMTGTGSTMEDDTKEGVLEDYLVKDGRKNRAMVVKPDDPRGKKARLSYRVVSEVDDMRLLDINLETGRFHQIRAQLASRTAPIFGDVKYGGVSTGRPLCLCAYDLRFTHPKTGERMEYEIHPKGEDFYDLLP